jgi:hypothetical protein
MMKNLIVLGLLSLVLVVFLSGCLGMFGQVTGSSTGTSTGVVITEFASDLGGYSTGEPVTLSLTYQNVGDADATNVVAILFGLNPAEWNAGNAFPNSPVQTLNKAIPS